MITPDFDVQQAIAEIERLAEAQAKLALVAHQGNPRFSAASMLLIAWVNAVRREALERIEACDEATRSAARVARRLCREDHRDGVDMVVGGWIGVPAPIAKSPAGDTTVVQNMLTGAVPLWTHYIATAKRVLDAASCEDAA